MVRAEKSFSLKKEEATLGVVFNNCLQRTSYYFARTILPMQIHYEETSQTSLVSLFTTLTTVRYLFLSSQFKQVGQSEWKIRPQTKMRSVQKNISGKIVIFAKKMSMVQLPSLRCARSQFAGTGIIFVQVIRIGTIVASTRFDEI